MKQLIKRILLGICLYSGFFEVMRWLSVRKGRVPILLYHRILDDPVAGDIESCFYILGIGIYKNLFERQLAYLKKRYRLISLKEYVQKKKEGAGLSGYAVVTFDDGFKDASLDLLRKYRIPATFFLIGEAFHKIYWRHLLFLLLDGASVFRAVLKTPSGRDVEVDLTSTASKKDAISTISKAIKGLSDEQKSRFLSQLKQRLGVQREYGPGQVYITEEDAGGLLSEGISFGAHSYTHADMASLSDEEISGEIGASIKAIKKLTDEKSASFALPFGRYDERIISALKREGLLCCVTSDNGFDDKEGDNYRIKRIFVNTRSFAEFMYKISGVETLRFGFFL